MEFENLTSSILNSFFFRYNLAKKRGIDLKFGMWIQIGRDYNIYSVFFLQIEKGIGFLANKL